MAQMIKAIETRYKGYRFRSRLEARWAVFFDALGLQWDYEPEGFTLPSGTKYLPDFRVVGAGITHWYEVKPSNQAQDAKLSEFASSVDDAGHVTLLAGDPIDALPGKMICPRCGGINHSITLDPAFLGEYQLMCHPCDWATPCGEGELEVGAFGIYVRPHKGWIMVGQKEMDSLIGLAKRAAIKARSARFEHGEVPA
jgi:hypothetical protein